MEPFTYSPVADLLAKFHSASEWIQALSLVTLTVMVVGASWCAADVLKALIAAMTPRRAGDGFVEMPPPGEADAQWLASRNGELWLMRLPAPPVSSQSRDVEPATHLRDGLE
jgi:hypothetical protein